ncbi:hypothetical protein EX30DRAFT_340639 [Ascodesmis nigricans]|uniref:Uncharacterized protein n=1 Tax=Ascodesmis nigricans TaxID=341454 RepID=A0A4V3SIT2_9PEZI|nr:hypothetical protein EX30DRAFT_340639 [Ascodesmis nigricans]
MPSANTSVPPTPTTSKPSSSSFASTSNPAAPLSKPLGPRPRAYDTGFREPFSEYVYPIILSHPILPFPSLPSRPVYPRNQ